MTDEIREVTFSELCGFREKQWLASQVADTHRFTLFGGARGPGKSYWLRWYALRQLLNLSAQGVRHAAWALFCESYPELTDRQTSKILVEFPKELGTVQDSKSHGLGFYLYEDYGGHVLLLRNLDDPAKYKSSEFAGISVDELTLTPKRTFDMLRGSLRWPGVARTQFCAGTNPDGKHAAWVRQLWIERDFTGEGFEELLPLRDEFAFVPALPTDNPFLSADYWHDLKTQPRQVREAWLEGSWYAKSSNVVYSDFDEGNLTDAEPDLSQPFEVGFDDGYIDPRVLLLIQRTSTGVLVFDEIAHSKRLDEESIRDLLELCARMYGKALPDAWPTMTNTARSAWAVGNGVKLPELAVGSTEAVQLMRRFREANIPARGGTHHVVDGVKVVRQLILDGNGVRSLQVNRRCKGLIGEMTNTYRYPDGVRRDSEKPEDGGDHSCDSLRYWCHMRSGRR
jgi:hypothetical protein